MGDALEQAQAVYTKLVGANVFTDPHSITDEQDRKISAIRITASQAENTFVKEINVSIIHYDVAIYNISIYTSTGWTDTSILMSVLLESW